jgi:glycosyltransferase involved in cell wall biosynthesis
MEQNWSVMGLLVRDLFPAEPPAVATGAYHINQFAYEQNTDHPGRLALLQREIYNLHYLDAQKVFMSEETRNGHEKFFQRDMPDGWIWPLPICMPDESVVRSRNPIPGRILSIGRLTRFKTYSWYMVPILRSLRERHPSVQWHVYGSGMCQEELVHGVWKDAIADGLIVFHGPLPYEKITTAFSEASVFIGMGTSILEAAAAGVPTIPAVVDDPDAVSWGFIDQLPYFSVGETVPSMNPCRKVAELLDEILGATIDHAAAIAARGRNYVEPYSEDRLMRKFLENMICLDRGRALPTGVRWRFLAIRFFKFLRNAGLSISRLGQPPLRHPGGDRVIY